VRSRHPRAAIERHTRRLLDSLDPDVRDGLSIDPIAVITARLKVRVQLRPERSGTGHCSIDGSYFPDPPRISVAESLSRRRVNFSVLHELGHHLQADDAILADILWHEPDGGTGLEEDVSDAFAAEVLLPQHLVDEIIGDAGPTAAAVADLFATTQASREACCVRAAHRVRGPGYVVLADPDGPFGLLPQLANGIALPLEHGRAAHTCSPAPAAWDRRAGSPR
jgi:IrrE N-terminal-like domain